MTESEDRAAVIAEVIASAAVYDLPSIATAGESQVIENSVVGEVTESGDLIVTVTASGMANSPKEITVPVLEEDTAYDVATKIGAELEDDSDVAGFFTSAVVGVKVSLTTKAQAAMDGTMNLSIVADDAEGITNAPTSTLIAEGAATDLAVVEGIVDRSKRGVRWTSGSAVATGAYVYPATPNGRRYRVTRGGNFGGTEPFSSESFPDTINDNTVTLLDIGPTSASLYDVTSAIREAWEAKAAKASRFMGVGGADMSKLFRNCKDMAEYYETALIG